ncbi:MAG: gluconate 2-dehydrogenase subunit 3 family protein [Myxococcaceae bacterium]|nr:gluconate 2-dehydrogenase subunit 3 family protein [Myxococcaceae bacterium]
MITRRSLIKRGIFGGALLTFGGGALGLALRRSEPVTLPAGGLKVLGAREYAALVAIARRIVTPKPGAPTADALDVAAGCDRVLAQADETSQVEVRQLLELFENALAGVLLGGRITPFSKLAPEEQDLVLHEWATSRFVLRRTGYLALRSLVTAVYWGNPKTWASVGYSGPPKAFHDPNAPVWKGGGEPRPPGPGVWVEP